jgi:hypothetical protein
VYDGGGVEELDENQPKPFSTSDAAIRHQHRDGHTEIRRSPTTIAEIFPSFAQLEIHDEDNDEDDEDEDNDDEDNDDIDGIESKLTEEEWRQRACDTLYGAWSHRCGYGD